MTPKKIEICSRWNSSKVLYVAKGAADIRTALQEAVERGANLTGANLTGAYLRGAYLRGANLRDANLTGAYLRGAYLTGAYLRGAYLRGAYLRDAYLRGADLRDAYLRGAYLRGADLRDANGINPYAVNDLLILTDQVGKVRAYKLVKQNGEGPFRGGITFKVGETYEVNGADCDPENQCGAGINLATLPWCIQNWRRGGRILLMEFSAKDIAAIPVGDGKFRVKKAKVIRELDLEQIGLTGVAA
jgi:hypothetical protein